MANFSVTYYPYHLQFKKPAGTSRGYLLQKTSWFLKIIDLDSGIIGLGECPVLPGLSPDEKPGFEEVLRESCKKMEREAPEEVFSGLMEWPAINFGLQTAWLDLQNGGKGIIYDNFFSRGEDGIPINGLVWMADLEKMWKEVQQKIEAGFDCIKFKVGALDFESELDLLQRIRTSYEQNITIRLDANGAFAPDEAMQKLEKLSKFNIHSIEQPIKVRQWDIMADLCKKSPIPIALDEELIGLTSHEDQIRLLECVKPQYLILKPSLLGGFFATEAWVRLAEQYNAGWWATSALESNIGLNAIAQWVGNSGNKLHQGLGTGALFVNNTPSDLTIKNGKLFKAISPTA